MSNFDTAIQTVLAHEGLFVDDPHDPGGATNYGISLRYLRTLGDADNDGHADGDIDQDGDVDAADIKTMTRNEALSFYRRFWWEKFNYGAIHHQAIATKVFDLAVNMGSTNAHRCLQRALRAAAGIKLTEDGILGAKTLQAVNSADPKVLVAALRSEAAGYYRSISYAGSERFRNGWLNRAYT